MSADETIISVLSALMAILGWSHWYLPVRTVVRPARPSRSLRLLIASPPFCLLLLLVILKTAASFDVRDDWRYLTMYLLMGAAWVWGFTRMGPLLGISARDDVVERGNGAAAVAVAGSLLGLTLCFGGANVGDGPGWWVVVISAALATGSLFACWLLLEAATGVSEAVTVERDPGAGLRLAGFLAAAGLVLGRGVAGDWVSADGLMRDFLASIWPLVPIVLMAALIERVLRPAPLRALPSLLLRGWVPAGLYLAAAVTLVVRLGMPH